VPCRTLDAGLVFQSEAHGAKVDSHGAGVIVGCRELFVLVVFTEVRPVVAGGVARCIHRGGGQFHPVGFWFGSPVAVFETFGLYKLALAIIFWITSCALIITAAHLIAARIIAGSLRSRACPATDQRGRRRT
jgi:hypothetical protein